MGIYTNGNIFGIKIYTVNDDDDNINILFIKNYDVIMSDEQMKEAYLFYTELNDKTNIFFKCYTECSSTYANGVFMMWYPMSLNTFLEKFGVY